MAFPVFSQEIPLNREIYDQIEGQLQTKNRPFFTSIKPFLREDLVSRISLDSLLYPIRQGKISHSLIGRKLCNENLFLLDTGDVRVSLDPVFHFSLGHDRDECWVNTRGFMVSGKIGKEVSFGTAFYENQAVFPGYLDSWIEETRVVPGQGPVKSFQEKGFDYAFASGYVSYTPSRYFNFTFGHGKNFIGEGYRSLLLSDNAFNYPFLKVTTTFWKIQYVNLYAQFMDRDYPWSTSLGYMRKYGTFHFLSADITKRLNIGLFEAVIWEAADSNGSRGFDVQYLNPVIFYRPVEFSLGSPDNALLGMNLKYRLSKHYSLYGQILLDDFNLDHARKNDGWWANKWGYQAGVSGWDLFRIRHLNFRAEYNTVRPYTYAHGNSLQCYGHYNQPLAHPLGANFREMIVAFNYSFRYWYASWQFLYSRYGSDTAGINYGKNIFLSYFSHPREFNNETGQGLGTTLIRNDFLLAFIINPRTNLRLEAGLSFRKEKNDLSSSDHTIYWFGLRTAILNHIYDW